MNQNLKLGIILIFVGIIFQIDKLEVFPNFDPWKLWPSVIIILGLFLLFKNKESNLKE
jgi:hypothetical protein